MSIADDLSKLEQMHERGTLSSDEYQRAKARLLSAGSQPRDPSIQAVNNFRRSLSDRWFGGLCGGLAQSTGVESWVWRLIFAFLMLVGAVGLVIYLVLWFFVPLQDAAGTYLPHQG
jgi:phage shock protein PspC (stress-responsive transcriptional regulator)